MCTNRLSAVAHLCWRSRSGDAPGSRSRLHGCVSVTLGWGRCYSMNRGHQLPVQPVAYTSGRDGPAPLDAAHWWRLDRGAWPQSHLWAHRLWLQGVCLCVCVTHFRGGVMGNNFSINARMYDSIGLQRHSTPNRYNGKLPRKRGYPSLLNAWMEWLSLSSGAKIEAMAHESCFTSPFTMLGNITVCSCRDLLSFHAYLATTHRLFAAGYLVCHSNERGVHVNLGSLLNNGA